MTGCCFGEQAAPEEFEPVPLSDQRTWSQVEELRDQLSSIIPPLDVDFEQRDATINLTSLPSGSLAGRTNSLGAFERRHSMRFDGGHQQQQQQDAERQRPENGTGLQWTDSRKLLEAAIAIEQMQPIPEDAAATGSSGGGGWGGDWGGTEAAEQRLQLRLFKLKLEHNIMEGDGNCQFRAISFGLYGTQRHHGYVRKKAVQYMQQRRQDFEAFLGEEFGGYIRQMARPGTWGDELTLRAACEALGVVVNVISSDDANWFLRYIPRTMRPLYEIFVTYVAPIHYNAVRRQNTGDRLRRSFGRQHSQLARAVSTYQRNYGIPETPQHVVAAAGMGG